MRWLRIECHSRVSWEMVEAGCFLAPGCSLGEVARNRRKQRNGRAEGSSSCLAQLCAVQISLVVYSLPAGSRERESSVRHERSKRTKEREREGETQNRLRPGNGQTLSDFLGQGGALPDLGPFKRA